MVDENPAKSYFQGFRQARPSQSNPLMSERCLQVIDAVIAAIQQGDIRVALSGLNGFKNMIQTSAPLLDEALESTHRSLMEVMALRKQILELSVELARLKGDEDVAAEYEVLISSMDEFFSASIADLDQQK